MEIDMSRFYPITIVRTLIKQEHKKRVKEKKEIKSAKQYHIWPGMLLMLNQIAKNINNLHKIQIFAKEILTG